MKDSNKNFSRGEKVYANTVDGAVELIVWEDTGESVCVCSKKQFDALEKGWNAPMPIGFPKTEVSSALDE